MSHFREQHAGQNYLSDQYYGDWTFITKEVGSHSTDLNHPFQFWSQFQKSLKKLVGIFGWM